jgi:hypothetical protein
MSFSVDKIVLCRKKNEEVHWKIEVIVSPDSDFSILSGILVALQLSSLIVPSQIFHIHYENLF